MAYSNVTYTGTGAQALYGVPFPYLSTSYVKVRIDGVLKTEGVDYSWPNTGSILLAGNLAGGAVLSIMRETPKATKLVDFQDGSVLTEADLDRSADQVFHLVQESDDAIANVLQVGTDGAVDGLGARFKNVAEPTQPTDAATKQYVDAMEASAVGAVNVAVATQVSNASASASTATAQAGIATSQAAAAATSASNASTSASNAAGSASAAATSASNASTSASNAAASAASIVGGGVQVKASAGDTTPAYLESKLVAGTNVTITKQNAGANENLKVDVSVPSGIPTGAEMPYSGRTAPAGWLMCSGQAVSRATYSALFAVMCPTIGTFTVSIASPGVITLNGHGLRPGEKVRFSTTGALPTGLSAGTNYFVTATSFTANTFTVSATLGGAAINTSGMQSGTHTCVSYSHGEGDGVTTFNLPDYRGRTPAGADAMGGTAASRLTSAGSGIYGGALGASGGAETVTLSAAQSGLPSHYHSGGSGGTLLVSGYNEGADPRYPASTGATSSAGPSAASSAHQNTQPTIVRNWIIKT